MAIENQTEETISLLDIIFVLARRWKLIFFITIVAAGLVLGYAFFTLKASPDAPFNYIINYYKPRVMIRVQDESASPSSLISQSGLGVLTRFAGVETNGSTSAELAMELIKGNTIIDQVVNDFDLINEFNLKGYTRTKSRNRVRESLETSYSNKTGILSIYYTDKDPELATSILNRLVELLEQRFENLTREKILNKKEFLENRLIEVSQELKTAQDELINFQIEKGIVDVIGSANETTGLATREFVFSEYIPRSERHEISSMYLNLERDHSILEGIYSLLMQQYETTKIEEMDDTRVFQVIEKAEVPEIKSGPSRARICMIVTAAAFIFAVFLAFALEFVEKVKKNPVESEKLKTIRDVLKRKKKRIER